MRRSILLLNFIIVTVTAHSNITCDACINNNCFKKIVILDNYQASGQLAIDQELNLLYIRVIDDINREYTGCIFLNSNNYEVKGITSASYVSFARAVDDKTHEVYISATLGMYKYNPRTKATVKVGLANDTIKEIYVYDDKVYYTTVNYLVDTFQPRVGLEVLSGGISKNVNGIGIRYLTDFIVDIQGDIYFQTYDYASTLRLKKDEKKTEIFADGLATFALDKFGDLHLINTTTRKLYKLDYDADKLVEIGFILKGNIDRFVIDRDGDIVYKDFDEQKLYYLRGTGQKCYVRTI